MAAQPSLNRREMIAGSAAIATTVAATSACSQDKLGKSYPELIAAMGHNDGSGRAADPMDIPKEMVRAIVMPAGKCPLRSAVHPSLRQQEKINQVRRLIRLERAKITGLTYELKAFSTDILALVGAPWYTCTLRDARVSDRLSFCKR